VSVLGPFQNFALFPTAVAVLGIEGKPLGDWEAIGVLIGDLTGGFVILQLTVPSTYLFSLEGWSMQVTAGVITDFQVTWRTDMTPDGQSWIVVGPGVDGSTVRSIAARDTVVHLPLATGRPRVGGVDTLTMAASVNSNNDIYRGNAWGRYWDHRATLAPGGLQRI